MTDGGAFRRSCFCLKIVCVKAFRMHGPRNGNREAKSDGEMKKEKRNE